MSTRQRLAYSAVLPSPAIAGFAKAGVKPLATKAGCVLSIGLAVLGMTFAQMASAVTTFYVTTNGTGNLSGSDWANATNDLQGAIDAIETGAANTVWVSNGVYQTGGRTNYPDGSLLTNRVVINKIITVRSANNDPANTIIKGAWDPATNGPAAVRGVYMVFANSWLIGFTVTNCATLAVTDMRGGGVYGGSVSNCILTGNSAKTDGGGASYATLYNCTIVGNHSYNAGGGVLYSILFNCTLSGNTAPGYGGGAIDSTLYNCLLIGNQGGHGGGVGYSQAAYHLYNCTIVGNQASVGGGIRVGFGATKYIYNCIIYSNNATTAGSNYYFIHDDYTPAVFFTNSCTTPAPTNGWAVPGNITNDPMFVAYGNGYGTSHVAGNYRLQANSPCVNTGTNGSWTTSYPSDLDGRIRVRYGTVDMGAYEVIYRGTIFKF